MTKPEEPGLGKRLSELEAKVSKLGILLQKLSSEVAELRGDLTEKARNQTFLSDNVRNLQRRIRK